MNTLPRPPWIRAALLAGAAYFVIGRLPLPVAGRLLAWALSGVVFAANIWHEHFKLRSPTRTMAWHSATGVAFGGLGLALAGMINSWSPGAGIKPIWFISLVAWPAITAIPAFLVALVVGTTLSRLRNGPAS